MTALPSTRAGTATLPTRERHARRTRVVPIENTTAEWNPRVLIVDDDAAVRGSISRVLMDSGYAVTEAVDGKRALESFQPNGFDLVILDIGLPLQTGWEVVERMTSLDPILPVMMITGQPDQIHLARAAGVGALLEKPLNAPQLLHVIRELLAESKKARINRTHGCVRNVRHILSIDTTTERTDPGTASGDVLISILDETGNRPPRES